MEKQGIHTEIWWQKLLEIIHLEEYKLNGRITLRWILEIFVAGSCLLTGFGISNAEPPTFANTALVTYKLVTHLFHAINILHF